MKRIVAVAGLALAFAWAGAATAKDDKKDGPSLRWAKSWAEAVAESRDRNAVIFATFHKDN